MNNSNLLQNSHDGRHKYLSILLVVAGSLIIRLLPLLSGRSLNWDEASLIAIADRPFLEMFPELISRDYHPAAFRVLLHGWMFLADNSDLAFRVFVAFWGALALVSGFFLAKTLTRSSRIAWLSFGLMVVSPFLDTNTQIKPQYDLHLGAVLPSWLFLVLLCQKTFDSPQQLFKQALFWGYLVFTLIALHSFITAALFLPFQWLYMVKATHPQQNSGRLALFLSSLALGLTLVPFLLELTLPWHVVHHNTVKIIHDVNPWLALLWLPGNWLWLGYDIQQLPQLNNAGWLYIYNAVAYGFIGWGLWLAYKRFPNAFLFLLATAVFPVLVLFLINVSTGLSVFLYRTAIIGLFPCLLAVAVCVDNIWLRSKLIGVLTALMLLLLPWVSPHRFICPEDPYRSFAVATRRFYQPGDGLVIYPGWSHLAFMRYFDSTQAGLTPLERSANPKKENIFSMISQTDDDAFIVSGDELLQTPAVQKAFKAFQENHPRILLVGFSPAFVPMLDCKKVWVLNRQLTFERFPCLTPPGS